MPRNTFKAGRYQGRGEDLKDFIVGEHAAFNSPFHFVPAGEWAIARGWVYRDYNNLHDYVAAAWTQTLTGAGSAFTLTAAGILATCDAADNDACAMQHHLGFTVAANKRAMMYLRVKISDATQSDLYAGFYVTDTSPVASEPADSAFLMKDDGAATMVGRSKDNVTGSSTATVATLANDTYVDLGVTIDGTTSISFHYKAITSETWTVTRKTSNLPRAGQVLRPSFLVQNGEAVAKNATINRLMFAWEL